MEGKSTDYETPSLPESIVMHEILPRLPVKSLIRFESVSKNWLDYISKNPNFAKLHMKFSSLLRPQFFISSSGFVFYEGNGVFYLLPHQNCSDDNDLEPALGYTPSYTYLSELVDSCNGLVCLYHEDDDEWRWGKKCYFGLWNPATRQCHNIGSPLGVHIGFAHGFGYVSSLDDYKIVSAFVTETDDEEVVFRGFYVFSLRSGKWEKIFGNFEYYSRDEVWRRIRGDSVEDLEKTKLLYDLRTRGLWHEGIIYWVPCRLSTNENIVGFDLRSNEFIEYGSLDWQSGYEYMELFRLKGSLALLGYKTRDESEFWMLKDGDDWGSWQKLVSVNLTNVHFVTLSENSKCLVQQSKQLKLVDLSKEALESCDVDEYYYSLWKAKDHVESLVSPFGMTRSEVEERNPEGAQHPISDSVPL